MFGELPTLIMHQAANDNSSLKDWYIAPKYDNLKQEILCNDICILSQTTWDDLLTKSISHLGTDKVKQMYCARQQSAVYYNMQYGTKMDHHHLISMMAYCNYDVCIIHSIYPFSHKLIQIL